MVYCLSCGSAHSQEHYEEEIARLRAALVEREAYRRYAEDHLRPGTVAFGFTKSDTLQDYLVRARGILVAEDLLPPE